jgi:acyl carrier protein
MASPELEAKLKDVIKDQLDIKDATRIIPEARFVEDLNADSLDLVEMIMELEEQFDVKIPDEEAEKILTVGDALKYIDEYQAEE